MKKTTILLLALLLCLMSACGESTPTLTLVLGDEIISVPGQIDELTKYGFMGDVNYTQEICHAEGLSAVEIELTEETETAELHFSCDDSEVLIQKELPDWTGETFENVDSIELEPGCSYYITGVFREGKYEYHMSFARIEVADTEETAAIKQEQVEHWDILRVFYYNGKQYRAVRTDDPMTLPEGYESIGHIFVDESQEGADFCGNFTGEAFWNPQTKDFYVKEDGQNGYAHFTVNSNAQD